jgi:hypothetical protein
LRDIYGNENVQLDVDDFKSGIRPRDVGQKGPGYGPKGIQIQTRRTIRITRENVQVDIDNFESGIMFRNIFLKDPDTGPQGSG